MQPFNSSPAPSVALVCSLLLTTFVDIVHAIPLDWEHSVDVDRRITPHLSIYDRTPVPNSVPVPSVAECVAHFSADLSSYTCMFYSGGTEKASYAYATQNGYIAIKGPQFDPDGWVTCKAGPCKEARSAVTKWTGAELQEYFNNVSAAYAQACSGDIYVGLLPDANGDLPIPSNSVFLDIELPIIRDNFLKNPKVVTTLTGVPLRPNTDFKKGTPVDGTPTGPLQVLLPGKCENTTP